jgi:hypothetical protein
MRRDFNIVGSFGAERITNINPERTINLFEFLVPQGKKKKMLLPTSGLNLKVDLDIPDGGFRSAFIFKGIFYFVVKNTVYQMDSLFVTSTLGTIDTDEGYIGVDANEFEVMWADGDKGYIWNSNTTTFAPITAPGFPTNPVDVTFLDGFFIVGQGESNQFNISAPNDGMTWDALDFALINTHPGTIVGLRTLHRRLFIFSQFFTEVWENAGQADFPLRRNNSLLMEVGTPAVGSINVNFDLMFFLSQARDGLGSIMMVRGTQPIPVSNQALDYQLQTYNNPSDCRGILYKDNGLIFYRLNFTEDDVTWVYNATQSSPQYPMWHEEQMLDGSRHVAQVHGYFNERNYFGSYSEGILYEVSDAFLDNAGEAIKRLRITAPFLEDTYNFKQVDRIQLDLQQGFVNPNEPDSHPDVFMFISRNDGISYGNGLTASMGKIGEFLKRTIWRKLGRAKNFIFRFEFYSKVKFVILGGEIDFTVLEQ